MLGEGPGVETFGRTVPVSVNELVADGRRWPASWTQPFPSGSPRCLRPLSDGDVRLGNLMATTSTDSSATPAKSCKWTSAECPTATTSTPSNYLAPRSCPRSARNSGTMTPTPPRRGRRQGASDTRETILVATREMFAAHGYERASVRAITTHAEMDPALVYHYFGSKRKLFLAAMNIPVDPDTRHGPSWTDRAPRSAPVWSAMCAASGTPRGHRTRHRPGTDTDTRTADHRHRSHLQHYLTGDLPSTS